MLETSRAAVTVYPHSVSLRATELTHIPSKLKYTYFLTLRGEQWDSPQPHLYLPLALKVRCVSALWSNIHKVARNERKGQGRKSRQECFFPSERSLPRQGRLWVNCSCWRRQNIITVCWASVLSGSEIKPLSAAEKKWDKDTEMRRGQTGRAREEKKWSLMGRKRWDFFFTEG